MDTFQIKYPTGNIYKGSVKIHIILNKTEKNRDGWMYILQRWFKI